MVLVYSKIGKVNYEGAKENNTTTVRMTSEVNKYIWRMGKKTFAANLEAMVIFCMKREQILYDQVQALEKRKADLNTEIQEQEELLSDLAQLKQSIDKIIHK